MNNVDTYISQFDNEVKERLKEIRTLIVTEVPEAEEGIMYGLIGYKLNKKPLIYFGAFSKHIGFYATPRGHKQFVAELSHYKQGKGSVQFPLDQPLPIKLIKRIVQCRKAELS
jgi:uncharacterized protein YdhG (YjbR/CyaY superfamily)